MLFLLMIFYRLLKRNEMSFAQTMCDKQRYQRKNKINIIKYVKCVDKSKYNSDDSVSVIPFVHNQFRNQLII